MPEIAQARNLPTHRLQLAEDQSGNPLHQILVRNAAGRYVPLLDDDMRGVAFSRPEKAQAALKHLVYKAKAAAAWDEFLALDDSQHEPADIATAPTDQDDRE